MNPTAVSRKPRGEYAKTEATKQAILDAAIEVFAQSGYRSGSLREIAQRVGMSEAGLLHHFKTKSALLQAVLDHRDEQSRQWVDLDDPDARIGLRGLIVLAERNSRTPGVVELYCTVSAEATSPDHPAHAYFMARYEITRAALADTFRRVAAVGGLREGVDPVRASALTLAMMDGLQVQWLLDREAIDMADSLRHFLDGLLIEPLGVTADHAAAEPGVMVAPDAAGESVVGSVRVSS